jgi:serine protease Do
MGRILALLAAVLAAVFTGYLVAKHLPSESVPFLTPPPAKSTPADTRPPAPVRTAVPAPAAVPALPSFAEVVAKVDPSVVGIISERVIAERIAPRESLGELRDLLREGDAVGEGEGVPIPPREGKEVDSGTGLVIDGSGYILTNHHVVQGATRILVQLRDGSREAAQIVGLDPGTDLVLLHSRALAGKLPAAVLGDSDQLRVGEWVMAIGDPLSFGETATAGIVSGKGRRLSNAAFATTYIQTDAAINFGNSGGPLVNLRGEVIGINVAISRFAQDPFVQGFIEGVGFAIPSNTVREVVEILRREGRVRRGYLGVIHGPVTELAAEAFGLDEARGALMVRVLDDLPAARAGVRHGDIILEVGGTPIRDTAHLMHEITRSEPGSTVELVLFREGRTEKVEVQLADRSESESAETEDGAEGDPARRATPDLGPLGFGVTEADPEVTGFEGVHVTRVDPLGAAWDGGLRPGMWVLEIDGRPVSGKAAFEAVTADLTAGHVARIYVGMTPQAGRLWVFVPVQ